MARDQYDNYPSGFLRTAGPTRERIRELHRMVEQGNAAKRMLDDYGLTANHGYELTQSHHRLSLDRYDMDQDHCVVVMPPSAEALQNDLVMLIQTPTPGGYLSSTNVRRLRDLCGYFLAGDFATRVQ